jgi:hypothetical protein
MRDRAAQVLPLLVESLNKEFKAQKPEMQVIAGALRGMSSFLVHFGAEFTSNAKNLSTLYRYMSLALEPLPNVNRYDIPKGAGGERLRRSLRNRSSWPQAPLFSCCHLSAIPH